MSEQPIVAVQTGDCPVPPAPIRSQAPTIKPGTKFALCIPAEQRFVPFAQWTPTLEDRAYCETDKSKLQILPYIVIEDAHGYVFVYDRPSTGTETRLHGLSSIGLGGHVDTAPPEGMSLREHLAREAIREVLEEVGWEVPLDQMLFAIDRAMPLYVPKTDVDAVHYALALHLRVPDRAMLTKIEQNEVLNARWMRRFALQQREELSDVLRPECFTWEMETWSSVWLLLNSSEQTYHGYMNSIEAVRKQFGVLSGVVRMLKYAVKQTGAEFPQMAVTERGQELMFIARMSIESHANVFRMPQVDKITNVHYDRMKGELSFIYASNGSAIVTRDFERWLEVQLDLEPAAQDGEQTEAYGSDDPEEVLPPSEGPSADEPKAD